MVPCEIIIEEIKTFHKLDTVNPWHIFYNYKKGQGTRLTKQGFTLLQPMFDSYKILLDKEHAELDCCYRESLDGILRLYHLEKNK